MIFAKILSYNVLHHLMSFDRSSSPGVAPMKKQENKFTFTIEKLTALMPADTGKRYMVYDATCTGLVLRVTDTGIKSFCVYKKFKNKPLKITLGKFPAMKIEQARKKATEQIMMMYEGKNPNKKKQADRLEMTLGDIYAFYDMQSQARNKELSVKKNQTIWRLYLKKWESKNLSDITRDEIYALQLKIKEEKGIYAANMPVRFLRLLYNTAIKEVWNGRNPTHGIAFFTEKSRDRFLQIEEFQRFFEALDNETNTTFHDIVLIALFTGVRKRNIFSMRWEHVDFTSKTWYIPETKNGDSQTVLLIDDILEILEKRKKLSFSEWVFPSETSKSGHVEEIYKN